MNDGPWSSTCNSRLRVLSLQGAIDGNSYRALRESGARVTDSPILLANDPPDEDSDDEIDSFERIVDVRAALLNVLECVRTATPIDSTALRLDVTKLRDTKLALETAFAQKGTALLRESSTARGSGTGLHV
jgi:hypothetical protein